jgi:DNA primase
MDVEALLQEKDVGYITQGADLLIKCLNPEHEDSHPSLRVDRLTGVFHCFSCKFKGNLFKYFGKEVSESDIKTLKLRQKIMELQRPISIELPSDAKLFNKDYRGISKDTLNSLGAFTTYEMEEMQDRVVFPIKNISGDTVALLGRYIYSQATPKYMVRPLKAKLPLFPALPTIRDGGIILVEGIFDAINLIDKGLTNVVCGFGTNTVSELAYGRLFAHLKILGVNKIYVMFDGDQPGNAAAEKLVDLFTEKGFFSEKIEMEDGVDPGSLSTEDIHLLRKYMYEDSDS